MTLLNHALRAGHAAAPRQSATTSVVIAGGGGALGSAVLEQFLSSARFAAVHVLALRRLDVAMQGLETIVVEKLDDAAAFDAPKMPLLPTTPIASTAVIVFDRARHANGRELAFLRPAPEQLGALARWLHARGVRRLVVVLPHTPAHLPEALKAGLANLDEHAVAALGFEHLVFVRPAQAPSSDTRAARWMQRVADGMLAQMRVMVAASNQPVRARKVAQFIVELVTQLDSCTPGTRVARPELVWQAAQLRDPAELVRAWLAGGELPSIDAPRARM